MKTVKLFCRKFISFSMRKVILFVLVDNGYSMDESKYLSEKIEEAITSNFWVKNMKSEQIKNDNISKTA